MASLTTGVVNRLLASGQPHDARAFLDQTRDTLPAPTRDKLSQFVTAAQDQHAGISAALQAQAAGSDSASNDPTGSDLAAQQHKLDTLRDDGHISIEAHAIASHKIQADAAAKAAAQQQNDTQTLNKVWALKNANPNAALTDLGAADYAYLKSRGLDANALAILQSHPASDDPALFNQLHRQATQDPVQFAKANLLAQSGKLSRAHMQTLQNLQDAINKQDPQAMQAGKRIDMTVNALMGDGPSAATDDASANAGADIHAREDQAQKLEAGLRDHLIAAQQSDPKLTLEDLHAAGAYFMRDWSLYGDGDAAPTDAAQQARSRAVVGPFDSSSSSGSEADQASDGAKEEGVGKQAPGRSAGSSREPSPARSDDMPVRLDFRQSLPVGAPAGAGTMAGQSAKTAKFAVGQHLPHGVIEQGDSSEGRIYAVKVRGKHGATDLETIAAETGDDYDQLKALNKISHDGVWKIANGTKIILPSPSPDDDSDANHTAVIDIGKATDNLDAHRESEFTGNCGTHVFDAIDAGRLPGGEKLERTPYAAEAGPSLLKLGFHVVLKDSSGLANYTPKKGDVVVLEPYPDQKSRRTGKHIPAGHIAMFDGKYWVSDKRQDGTSRIWAGLGFEKANVGMVVYRP